MRASEMFIRTISGNKTTFFGLMSIPLFWYTFDYACERNVHPDDFRKQDYFFWSNVNTIILIHIRLCVRAKCSSGRFPETRLLFLVNTIIFRFTNWIRSSIVTKMWCDTVVLFILRIIEIFLLPIMQITYFESLYYLYFSWWSTKKTRHMVLFCFIYGIDLFYVIPCHLWYLFFYFNCNLYP